MNFSEISIKSIYSAWEVLVLFLIPIGGGIPAGVLLAKNKGFNWQVMMSLYLISDVILAFLFEPVIWLILYAGKKSPVVAKVIEAFKKSMDKSVSKYGMSPGPITLITVSFGVDPMTGRTAARAAGHNFFSGWTLAIIGDMLFFTVLMASTLWLNNILGDGTWTAVIIMVGMIAIPVGVRRVRKWISRVRTSNEK
jgi:hypothetical protein